MKFVDYFSRIYMMHIPERVDRLTRVTRELEMAGMPFRKGNVELFPPNFPSDPAGFLNVRVRGSFLDQFDALRRAAQEKYKNILILEDDLVFKSDFKTREPELIQQLDGVKWDFVYFGYANKINTKKALKSFQPFSGPLQGTHFFGFNNSIFTRLISFLEALQKRPVGSPEGGPMYVDGAYSLFRKQNPDVITLVANPVLGWQGSSRSSIHPNWFDSSGIRLDFFRKFKIAINKMIR